MQVKERITCLWLDLRYELRMLFGNKDKDLDLLNRETAKATYKEVTKYIRKNRDRLYELKHHKDEIRTLLRFVDDYHHNIEYFLLKERG